MIKNFKEIREEVKKGSPATISVAAAHDEEALLCVKSAIDEGIAGGILVGDEPKIRSISEDIGLATDIPVIHETDPVQAALKAVSLVREGKADVFLKGLLNTGDYMKAVLDREAGLRTGRLLSHLAAYEVPGSDKLLFAADTGINIAPDFDALKQIMDNSFDALKLMGLDSPKTALMAANERVNPKIQYTADAKALAEYYSAEPSFTGVVEGPVAIDVAYSKEAAAHKGIESKVSGDVDLYIVPDMQTGNIWSKSVILYGKFNFAGVILGASNPVILVSRSDDAETKLNSIAFGCFLAQKAAD